MKDVNAGRLEGWGFSILDVKPPKLNTFCVKKQRPYLNKKVISMPHKVKGSFINDVTQ